MTTKRKQILKAIAFASCTTMDDMVLTTGMERKNLHDNVKACLKEDLCERFKDDVTGRPAYKLTPKGRQWLEDDKDDSGGKPHAQVGKNSASKAAGSHVVGGDMSADPLPAGNAVKAPPKPDRMPVEVSADEIKDAQRNADLEVRLDSAGRSIVEFCEWLAKKAKVRCPLNLHECKAVVTDALSGTEINADLEAMALEQAITIKKNAAEIDDLEAEISSLHIRIALLESNKELPLTTRTEPERYIITDTYMQAQTREHANEIALELAKEIPINTPVMVFETSSARELRIDWRNV